VDRDRSISIVQPGETINIGSSTCERGVDAVYARSG